MNLLIWFSHLGIHVKKKEAVSLFLESAVTIFSLAGTMMPISTQDRGFLHYVAFADIQKHLSGVLSIIKSNYPTTLYSDLLVRMDYTHVSMKPLVTPASSFPYFDESEKERVEGLLKLSGLDTQGRITLICFVSVPATPMTQTRCWPQLATLRLPRSSGMSG